MIRVELNFCNSEEMPPQKRLKVTVEEPNSTSQASTSKERDIIQTIENFDWRHANWRDRHHYALRNKKMCDITFEVEGREIPAHKLLLAMASPVFESMFFGAMAEKGDKVVIQDLTAFGFEALLKFIYANELSLCSLDQAFQLWVAADKYMVPQVKVGCRRYFQNCTLRPDNIWSSLQTAIFLDIEELAVRCYDFLQEETENAMEAEDFTCISVGAMTNFLRLEHLSATEFTLMKGLIQWGRERLNDQPDMGMEQALEPCVKFIRFGWMKLAEFCEILDVAPKAFKDSDSVMILKHLAKPALYPLPDWVHCKRQLPPKERQFCLSSSTSHSQLAPQRWHVSSESYSNSATYGTSSEDDSECSLCSGESSGSGRKLKNHRGRYTQKRRTRRN
ncbi:hypothetical protein JTE90_013474 [Oedothorax gibbosus]|uniref:BTB domain-containing protein n=1 Tax=Oedothorax gibbosus TaxID=931172 RepID=A0AAV6VL16_9ARAC|nr:hypothetical protein JTE90_013474 [Oedothorax gibbosus]